MIEQWKKRLSFLHSFVSLRKMGTSPHADIRSNALELTIETVGSKGGRLTGCMSSVFYPRRPASSQPQANTHNVVLCGALLSELQTIRRELEIRPSLFPTAHLGRAAVPVQRIPL